MAQTLPATAYLPAQNYPNTMAAVTPQPPVPAGNLAYGAAPGQGNYMPNAGNPGYTAPPGQGYYVPTAAAPGPTPIQSANPQRMLPTPPPPGTGVVDQMLREASPAGCNGGGISPNGNGCYSGPVNQYGQAAQGQASCDIGAGACNHDSWYGSANALFMSRSGSNRVFTSYENNNNPNQLMNTDMPLAWQPGGELRIGRRFCCGQWAVEGVYWSLADFSGHTSVRNPNGVSTPLAVDQIDFPGVVNNTPIPGTAYFDNACEHDLWRDDSLQNVEVNLIRNVFLSNGNCCDNCPWDLSFLVGARYFRFEDSILLGALQPGSTWGQNGGINEAYLGDTVVNNLYGIQVGFDAAYRLSNSVKFCVGTKFGCFENHMTGLFKAYRGDGQNAFPDPSSGETGTYPVSSTKDGVSFMGQIDLGLQWNFHENWSAQIGYRVVALTGVALSDSQIPFYACDIPEESFIKSADCLVLHGAYAGISFNF
jgi:hypothetical protein